MATALTALRFGSVRSVAPISVTRGQLLYEWEHLLRKLVSRSPAHYRKWRSVEIPNCHPLLTLRPGGIASWERTGA